MQRPCVTSLAEEKLVLCTITVCKTVHPDLIEQSKACLSAPDQGSLDLVKGFKVWQFKPFSSLLVHVLGCILNSYHCICTLNERKLQKIGWKAFRYFLIWLVRSQYGHFSLWTVCALRSQMCHNRTSMTVVSRADCRYAQICILPQLVDLFFCITETWV